MRMKVLELCLAVVALVVTKCLAQNNWNLNKLNETSQEQQSFIEGYGHKGVYSAEDERIYLFGGRYGAPTYGWSAKIWEYNPINGNSQDWGAYGLGTSADASPNGIAIRGNVVYYNAYQYVYRYNLNNNVNALLVQVSQYRSSLSLSDDENILWIAGQSQTLYYNFNDTTLNTMDVRGTYRNQYAPCVYQYGDKVHILAGQYSYQHVDRAAANSGGSWDQYGSLNFGHGYMTCMKWDQFFYHFAGLVNGAYTTKIGIYDFTNGKSKSLSAEWTFSRYFAATAYADNRIWLINGYNGYSYGTNLVESTNVMNPPTPEPTQSPTLIETTASPTINPASVPSRHPSTEPTVEPTTEPTKNPTMPPTRSPSAAPSTHPTTLSPTSAPSAFPTQPPTAAPTSAPTYHPTPETDGDYYVPVKAQIISDELDFADIFTSVEQMNFIRNSVKHVLWDEMKYDEVISSLPEDWVDYYRVVIKLGRRRLADEDEDEDDGGDDGDDDEDEGVIVRLIVETDFESLAENIDATLIRDYVDLEEKFEDRIRLFYNDTKIICHLVYSNEDGVLEKGDATSPPDTTAAAARAEDDATVTTRLWWQVTLGMFLLILIFGSLWVYTKQQRRRDKRRGYENEMALKLHKFQAKQQAKIKGPKTNQEVMVHKMYDAAHESSSGDETTGKEGKGVTGLLNNMLKTKQKQEDKRKLVLAMGAPPANSVGFDINNYMIGPANMMEMGMGMDKMAAMAQWQNKELMEQMKAQGKEVNPFMMSTDQLAGAGEGGGGGGGGMVNTADMSGEDAADLNMGSEDDLLANY